VIGVELGSAVGLRLSGRMDARWLEGLLATVLVAVGVAMLARAS
jgi:uncharacterized membrane protein YfcA